MKGCTKLHYNRSRAITLFTTLFGDSQNTCQMSIHKHFWQNIIDHACDTKCFPHVSALSDHSALQEDITALSTWSRDSDLDINLKKFVHLSFKCKLDTSYTISDMNIPHHDSHKDLGLILSADLNWDIVSIIKPLLHMLTKVLALIRWTSLSSNSTFTMVKLYVSLVQSQLLFCTQICRLHLMKDILIIEHVQCHATKHIFNDYTSCYKCDWSNLNYSLDVPVWITWHFIFYWNY